MSGNGVQTPNEIAIKKRDNDHENHWIQWGTQHFQTNPYIPIYSHIFPYIPISSISRCHHGLQRGHGRESLRQRQRVRRWGERRGSTGDPRRKLLGFGLYQR